MEKRNYYVEIDCTDICFCASDCKNEKCSRNMNNRVFKAAYADGYYTCSEFGGICSSYSKPQ